ncbi:uncharacterized protein EAE98_011353 [Botrytis deweyae]|uniref:Uncharacterized protein n=1 Tax=Botrytis deweyae TaxID=2478750 RepID=A0ABQ7I696_9HELO|nr:uncharacterized protein EAE98_011353 [Botrytis deweyae]KAF7915030.1 hypothetical protein EAE98_011353 [Botrytis deweyae]
MYQLSVGGPACTFNNDCVRGRRLQIQPDPQHSVPTDCTTRQQPPSVNDFWTSTPEQLDNQPGRFNLSSSTQVALIMVLAPILNKYYNDQKSMGEINVVVFFGRKLCILPIDLQSSEFLVFFLGGWTTINIDLCTAVSTILERSQLVQSLKSSRFKFFELCPKFCPWTGFSSNHKLSKSSTWHNPAHLSQIQAGVPTNTRSRLRNERASLKSQTVVDSEAEDDMREPRSELEALPRSTPACYHIADFLGLTPRMRRSWVPASRT